jgi:uncharacterized membrane protein YuzA (DUF378 family)
MNMYRGLVIFLTLVVLIGGVNWLMVAINTWSKDEDMTYDLLQDQLKIHRDVANVVYIVVFICTLLLSAMILFPQTMMRLL